MINIILVALVTLATPSSRADECTNASAEIKAIEFLKSGILDQNGKVRIKNISVRSIKQPYQENIFVHYTAKISSGKERFKKYIGMILVSDETCEVVHIPGWAEALPLRTSDEVAAVHASETRNVDADKVLKAVMKSAGKFPVLLHNGVAAEFDVVKFLKETPYETLKSNLSCVPVTSNRASRLHSREFDNPSAFQYQNIEGGDVECSLRTEDYSSCLTFFLDSKNRLKGARFFFNEIVG